MWENTYYEQELNNMQEFTYKQEISNMEIDKFNYFLIKHPFSIANQCILVTEEKTIQIMELASQNALIYFMNRIIIDPIFPKDSPDIVLDRHDVDQLLEKHVKSIIDNKSYKFRNILKPNKYMLALHENYIRNVTFLTTIFNRTEELYLYLNSCSRFNFIEFDKEIKIAHISKIITSALVGVGAMFLGEYFEQFLNKIPGMTFEIKLLGTIANILGMFFASLLTGILGAIIINGLDQFISKKLIEENQKKQANKKNELLRIQDVQIFVAEQNVAVKRNDIFSKMAKNHQKLRELLGNLHEEFSNSKTDSTQRLLDNEIYFDDKQSELEEMQNALNDLL